MVERAAAGALLAILCAVAIAESTPKNRIPALTPDQWRQDLHVLATEVARRHKNAFHFMSKAQFDAAVGDLDKRIPRLQGYEVMIGMMRILSMVGDGHTRSDDLFNSFSQFPLDLYWFGESSQGVELKVAASYPVEVTLVPVQWSHPLNSKSQTK